ncbi:MAG: anthranilate phosphoribosyltransferase [bacterium]|nr:anthranilate phosphoribosyltransferase [bacterium]
MEITDILKSLSLKQDLSTEQTETILTKIIDNTVPLSETAAFLMGLKIKGESPNEILGLIQAMRSHMNHIDLKNAIDVCGTGGDGKESFNVSTAVAFVVAGAGVKVAKHGNRAASSKCGSADVLEELGVNINLTPVQAKKVFEKIGMIFLFAPLYHQSLKNVIKVRKQLKIPTVFNYLGPFANPASVKRQIIGVPNTEIARKLSKVAKELRYDHILIVSSKDGLDELSISSESVIYEIKNNQIKTYEVDPSIYGFNKNNNLSDIKGKSKIKNAKIIREILNGSVGPKRDIVILNSAFALYVASKVKKIENGISLAEQSIDNGNAKAVLQKLINETKKYA